MENLSRAIHFVCDPQSDMGADKMEGKRKLLRIKWNLIHKRRRRIFLPFFPCTVIYYCFVDFDPPPKIGPPVIGGEKNTDRNTNADAYYHNHNNDHHNLNDHKNRNSQNPAEHNKNQGTFKTAQSTHQKVVVPIGERANKK